VFINVGEELTSQKRKSTECLTVLKRKPFICFREDDTRSEARRGSTLAMEKKGKASLREKGGISYSLLW